MVGTGISFAVLSPPLFLTAWGLSGLLPGYDPDFHDDRFSCRLRVVWAVVTSNPNRDLLGRTVCEHQLDWWDSWLILSRLSSDVPPLSGPSRWGAAMALYMIGFISYGATLVFYAAVFPRLARNTPHASQLRDKYEAGEISAEEYEVEESLEKNRISNISTVRS